MDALTLLTTRRSVSVRDMDEPAPTPQQIEAMLRIATRVPDHGKLAPWRIKVLQRSGQKKLGKLLREIFSADNPNATDAQKDFEWMRPQRAPLLVAVLSTSVLGKIPVWEQQLSAGAVCMNLLHAAHAMGYGAKWLTEWPAYDDRVLASLLNLPLEGGGRSDAAGGGAINAANVDHPTPPSQPSPLKGEGASIAGFIYIGTPTTTTDDRPRPELSEVVAEWK